MGEMDESQRWRDGERRPAGQAFTQPMFGEQCSEAGAAGRLVCGSLPSLPPLNTPLTSFPLLSSPCSYQKVTKKAGKVPGKGGSRWYKSVGLGFKTPQEAIEGNYIDHKCPFTGNVSIRGRILSGVVRSTKMNRTIVVRRDYLHYIKKYQRYEKRHTNISAHISPAFRCHEGDVVTIGQCRPLSKTVRFNVLRVVPAGSSSKKGFSGF